MLYGILVGLLIIALAILEHFNLSFIRKFEHIEKQHSEVLFKMIKEIKKQSNKQRNYKNFTNKH